MKLGRAVDRVLPIATDMEAIKYRSLSEITAERLRQLIITGQLSTGARVTETEISQIMGVSRVVVREAMLMLMRQGLLAKERNRFTRVVDFEKKDVEDVFDLRIAIEKAAAKRCLGNGGLEQELTSRAADMKAMLSEKGFDKERLMYKDMDFHKSIIVFSKNERLLNVWEEISGPLFILLYRYINFSLEYSLNYSHEEIIGAIRDADELQVNKEIERHIEDTKHAMMGIFPS